MVAAKTTSKLRRTAAMEVPMIDLSWEKSKLSNHIVKACEEYGFFKVINHGVHEEVVEKMENRSFEFFAKPAGYKQKAGPANPCGYGSKNIGFNGDFGEVEYLILHTNNPLLNNEPFNFISSAVKGYVEEVKELTCKMLELMSEGLHIQDSSVFSCLIKDAKSDSVLRLNHYPPLSFNTTTNTNNTIGFGEHTDPQILTLLKSNDVDGLQVSLEDGVWVPISPQPRSAFFVNVGDALQALTNGRFKSVRHRVMVSSMKTRMSMAYFGAPAPDAIISCPPELVTSQSPRLYNAFTWADYKKATYSRRLGDSRLHLFGAQSDGRDETRE